MKPPTTAPDQVQDEGFFSVLLDITKKHPILFTLFFLIPFAILLISLWYKWFYFFNDTTHYPTDFQVVGGKENKLKETAIYLKNTNAQIAFEILNDQADGESHAFLKYLGKIFNEYIIVETYRSRGNSSLSPTANILPYHPFLIPTIM